MSREEQIEELASVIFDLVRSFALSRALASILYDKGYRKASEVAKDIYRDIKHICDNYPLFGNTDTLIMSESDFEELEKKYTEDK